MRVAEAKTETELIGALERLRVERLNNRRAFEEVWWNNIALVAGDHYMRWEPTLGTYVERPVEDHAIRLVLNHARVVARTELAKLTKSRPVMEVIPKSEDREDVAATRVASFALDAMEFKFKLYKYRKRSLWWMVLTGLGALMVGYNSDDDRDGMASYVIDPNTGEPTFNDTRIQVLRQMLQEGTLDDLEEDSYPLGDLDFRVYSPFQLLPDDTVLEFDEVKDLITTDIVQIDRAKKTWGKELRPDDKQPGVIEQRMIRRLGLGLSQAYGGGAARDTVQVHTWWLEPNIYDTPLLKDGIMVRWANTVEHLETEKPFPFNDHRIPFIFLEHVPNATAIWPSSVLEDIRSPNLELDKTVSQLLENRDYMANPMWRRAEQTIIRGDKIKSQPGGEIRYVYVRDVPPPEPIRGEPLPVQVENLAVALRDQILDLSGQGEVSRGRVPPGVRAGIQMQYLIEEDETKLGPTTENVEEGVALMSSMVLSRLGQFYGVSRLLRNYRRGGGYDIRKFKGADLRGTTDVVPVQGSARAKSKAQRQQNAITMVEMGIPIPPKKIKDILEIGGGELDEVDLAYAQAERENELMVQGVKSGKMQFAEDVERSPEAQVGLRMEEAESTQGPMAIPVKKWHNHEAHLERHVRFMMDEEYERLASEHPDIDRLFDEHVSMHQQEQQAIIQAQLEQAMALRGMPGETGSPAPPKRDATPPQG